MRVPRLSETEILIASAISGKELYGLQIVDEVLALTRGKRRISLGGLYTTLHRMEDKKLVTSRWGETVDDRQGARRRYITRSRVWAHELSPRRRGSWVLRSGSPTAWPADGASRPAHEVGVHRTRRGRPRRRAPREAWRTPVPRDGAQPCLDQDQARSSIPRRHRDRRFGQPVCPLSGRYRT